MATKVAINGFGRIGRNVFRAALARASEIEFVAVNDLTDPGMLAHLLKYDSVYGQLDRQVRHDERSILVGEQRLRVFSQRDPGEIPWEEVGADIVIEGTGFFRKREDAAKHLRGHVKKVIITAPAIAPDVTIALGVNEETYNPAQHTIISNASCTTNCLAPVAKVLHHSFGIERGLMTTIHSYTNDQRILDLPHKDLRRARAAALSMIPTTTGAAVAVSLVLPELEGRLDGISIRVPTPTVSLVDVTVLVEKSAPLEDVQDAFRRAASGPMNGILQYTEEELVSSDFSGNPHSAVVDGPFLRTLGSNMVKVLAWYDNEWGYSNRVLELAEYVGQRL
ncbi:MAG: type I glyceraldehyde-3-phosphate dehydrogenase [Acidobacteriota bacterium]